MCRTERIISVMAESCDGRFGKNYRKHYSRHPISRTECVRLRPWNIVSERLPEKLQKVHLWNVTVSLNGQSETVK